jgi:hypothetical protein
MKLKATKNSIKNGFNRIISISYCNAQHLLHYKNPFAYSSGIYGWSCDYYEIGNICISTGYSPIGQKVDYNKLRVLEQKASEIVHNYDIQHEQKVIQLDALISELIAL